jgi:Arc/MetJ-type ribon-helix-helix transcriptional regulator
MIVALGEEQERIIGEMIRNGRFATETEAVAEALRRLANEDCDYLSAPPLTAEQIEQIYGPNQEEDERERKFGLAAFESVRDFARKSGRS